MIDVRFYPLATIDTERYELDDRVHSALRHMVNLEHLVWTVGLVHLICPLKLIISGTKASTHRWSKRYQACSGFAR